MTYDDLGRQDTVTAPTSTDMLYSGEQFDPELQWNYHRARYYDMSAGVWNRLDPFSGNHSDPQSLHKYAYCHGDPVNGVDPSGEMNIVSRVVVIMVFTIVSLMLLDATLKTLYRIKSKQIPENIYKLTSEKIIALARQYIGSRRWSRWTYIDPFFNYGINKCNKFVFDVIDEIAPRSVRYVVSNRGFLRPPTANEWASDSFFMAGWSQPVNNPPPGSVISDGGHCGFTDGSMSISASSLTHTVRDLPLSASTQRSWGFGLRGRYPLHWDMELNK